jgi:hypothetical protein
MVVNVRRRLEGVRLEVLNFQVRQEGLVMAMRWQ